MTPEERKDAVLGYLNKKAVIAKENADSYRNIANSCMVVGDARRAKVAFEAWERCTDQAKTADELICKVDRAWGIESPSVTPSWVRFTNSITDRDAAELMYQQALAYAEAQ